MEACFFECGDIASASRRAEANLGVLAGVSGNLPLVSQARQRRGVMLSQASPTHPS